MFGVYVNVPLLFNTTLPFNGAWIGVVVTVCVWPCGSVSFNNTLPLTGTFFVVLAASSLAYVWFVPGDGDAVTVTVTFAVSQATGVPLSHILYKKLVSPTKPSVGVNVIVPSPFTTAVPLFTGLIIVGKPCVLPSGSVSLAFTAITTGVVFGVVASSFWAIVVFTPGAGFGRTSIDNKAVSHTIPVHTLYLILSVPINPVGGV